MPIATPSGLPHAAGAADAGADMPRDRMPARGAPPAAGVAPGAGLCRALLLAAALLPAACALPDAPPPEDAAFRAALGDFARLCNGLDRAGLAGRAAAAGLDAVPHAALAEDTARRLAAGPDALLLRPPGQSYPLIAHEAQGRCRLLFNGSGQAANERAFTTLVAAMDRTRLPTRSPGATGLPRPEREAASRRARGVAIVMDGFGADAPPGMLLSVAPDAATRVPVTLVRLFPDRPAP